MSKQDVIDYVMETPHNTNRAVLEGLVDTAVEESQVQADWNQNDPTASDYVKNRICYDNSVSISTTIDSSNIYITNSLTNEDLNTFSDWCTGASPVSLKINNTVYTLQPGGFADGIYTLNYNNTAAITRNIRSIADYLGIKDGFPVEKTIGLSFTLYVGEIKQIDKKYIPDELFTQANWNENNETSPAYIQNRICYEETVPDTYEELQLTTSNWKSLTGYVKGSDLSKMLSIPLNFIVNGVKHYNVSPEWYFESKTEIAYFFNESKTVYVSVKKNDIDINGVSLGWYPSSSNISFFKTIKHENLVKQIDSKYIPIDSIPTEGSTNAASSDALAKLASYIDMIEEYIGSKISDKELILFSSTENSTKKFKITVNDSGTISAKEVTEGA